jgi:hypothetical protein
MPCATFTRITQIGLVPTCANLQSGLRYFSECQVSEHQISERQIAEIHLFELPNFQTEICSKSQIFELIFVRITNFRTYKIFEQKLVVPGVILSSLDLTNLT